MNSHSYQTDSDNSTEGNGKFKEIELKESSTSFLSVMYNIDGRTMMEETPPSETEI